MKGYIRFSQFVVECWREYNGETKEGKRRIMGIIESKLFMTTFHKPLLDSLRGPQAQHFEMVLVANPDSALAAKVHRVQVSLSVHLEYLVIGESHEASADTGRLCCDALIGQLVA